MASIINTNVNSLMAQMNLNKSQSSLATSLQRLSSGLRINTAADDAAGFAISTRMSSQIGGLDQAARNANDGVSLAQTALTALSSITDALQQIRTLAVQSANATNNTTDRGSLQNLVTQAVQQINAVANQTNFNGVKLLDGSFTNAVFQTGANAGESIAFGSIASASASSLGVGTNSSYSTTLSATVTAGAIGNGGLTLNGFATGASAVDGVSDGGGADSAIAKANAINAVSGSTGVTASVGATSVSGVAPTAKVAIAGNATDYIYVNGVKLGAIAAGGDFIAQGSNVAAAFNAVASQTGVTARADSTTGGVTLSAVDGRNISLVGGGTGKAIANTGLTITDAVTAQTVTGTFTGSKLASGDLTINGVNIGAVSADATGANLVNAINAVSAQSGVTAAISGTTLTLTGVLGHNISIGGATGGAGAASSGLTLNTNSASVTYGSVALNSTSSSGITIGGGDVAFIGETSGANAATVSSGQGVATVNLLSAAGAQAAISIIDAAIQNVNVSAGQLGALQTRFTAAVSNLQSNSTNLSAARSRIQDKDFAAETANLTRNQILQQAGTAMLAQANSLPQTVLTLLK